LDGSLFMQKERDGGRRKWEEKLARIEIGSIEYREQSGHQMVCLEPMTDD
jgi:hypothetical protein